MKISGIFRNLPVFSMSKTADKIGKIRKFPVFPVHAWNLTLTYTCARDLKFTSDPDQVKTRPKPKFFFGSTWTSIGTLWFGTLKLRQNLWVLPYLYWGWWSQKRWNNCPEKRIFLAEKVSNENVSENQKTVIKEKQWFDWQRHCRFVFGIQTQF